MKKFIFILIVCFLLFPCGPLFSLTKPTVVVVGFDITVPGLQYEQTLPNALTDLMINALINSNRFRVFERRKLENLVTEQQFPVLLRSCGSLHCCSTGEDGGSSLCSDGKRYGHLLRGQGRECVCRSG